MQTCSWDDKIDVKNGSNGGERRMEEYKSTVSRTATARGELSILADWLCFSSCDGFE